MSRPRINREIIQRIERALEHADLTQGRCAVPSEHRDAMKRYLDTWVVNPLAIALAEIRGERVKL